MSTITLPYQQEYVTCNRCGSSEVAFRYKLVVSEIVTCTQCQLSYVNPRATSSWLQSKLQEWATIDTVDKERLRIAFDEATLDLYRRYLAWLDKLATLPTQAKLLDIGCSVGAFLSEAQQHGFSVHGLEVGEASAAYARESHQLNVDTASMYERDFPDSSFDVISLLEVIEHLEAPKQAIERLAKWLKPGGLLLITTPNFNSYYRRIHGARWWVINCEDEHIYFFDIKSLSGMLEECGFKVRFVHTRGFDISGIIRQFRTKETSDLQQNESQAEDNGYYAQRSSKEKIKALFKRLGLLTVVRALLRGLDWLSSQAWSPLYGSGEQLIMIAEKRT